jgi:hypothetical protein
MGRKRPPVDEWNPGQILPERRETRRPISLRVPHELYEALGLYAKRVGATRSYLIVECMRRMLAADGMRRSPEIKTSRRGRVE